MKKVGQPVRIKEEKKEAEIVGYKCKFCGEPDRLIEYSRETALCHGYVENIDGDCSDRETDDYENFEITGYSCNACGQNGHGLEEMIEPVFDGEEDEES